MEKREARVYYVQESEDRKAILVFDAGHAGGDVYVYEFRESYPTEQIKEEAKNFLRLNKMSKTTEKEMVGSWVEKKFGFPLSWKLTSE